MYQLAHTPHVCNQLTGELLPLDDPDYLDWLADGNIPAQPFPNPVVVPKSVSRFQARAALHQAGLLDAVEGKMVQPETTKLAQLAWEDADQFLRDSPTVLGMAQALGLDAAALDALFITAAKIVA